MTPFTTPILLLIFNRPEHTARVLDRIRGIRPAALYVVADGPRVSNAADTERCRLSREVISNGIDWPCELKTLFREENRGCGHGPAEGITWFFDQAGEGIILEDDCLPELSFFPFCKRLLEEYRKDEKVMAISGFNFCGAWRSDDLDYFFSDGGNWGWAGWKRAWDRFDFSLSSWPKLDAVGRERVKGFYPDFESLYQLIAVNGYDAWDIQWHYARLVFDGLSITPTHNLIRNIGFDGLGAHTNQPNALLSEVATYNIPWGPALRGPSDRQIDLKFRQEIFARSKPPEDDRVVGFLKKMAKKMYLKTVV